MAGRPTHGLGWISQVHQDQPADDRVEGPLETLEHLHVPNNELDIGNARRGSPLSGTGHCLRIALDADDVALRANQPRRQERRVPRA